MCTHSCAYSSLHCNICSAPSSWVPNVTKQHRQDVATPLLPTLTWSTSRKPQRRGRRRSKTQKVVVAETSRLRRRVTAFARFSRLAWCSGPDADRGEPHVKRKPLAAWGPVDIACVCVCSSAAQAPVRFREAGGRRGCKAWISENSLFPSWMRREEQEPPLQLVAFCRSARAELKAHIRNRRRYSVHNKRAHRHENESNGRNTYVCRHERYRGMSHSLLGQRVGRRDCPHILMLLKPFYKPRANSASRRFYGKNLGNTVKSRMGSGNPKRLSAPLTVLLARFPAATCRPFGNGGVQQCRPAREERTFKKERLLPRLRVFEKRRNSAKENRL